MTYGDPEDVARRMRLELSHWQTVIVPELRGRLQSAEDRIERQRVILAHQREAFAAARQAFEHAIDSLLTDDLAGGIGSTLPAQQTQAVHTATAQLDPPTATTAGAVDLMAALRTSLTRAREARPCYFDLGLCHCDHRRECIPDREAGLP